MELSAPYASYPYERGYIVLPIQLDATALPDTFGEGPDVLHRKDEFHVTLVGKTVTDLSRSLDDVVATFNRSVATHPVRFRSFEPDFRLPAEGEKRTLVVRARVDNLEGLFAALQAALGENIPIQAPHVTLYERTRGESVAIPSDICWNSFERIEVPAFFDKLRNNALGRDLF